MKKVKKVFLLFQKKTHTSISIFCFNFYMLFLILPYLLFCTLFFLKKKQSANENLQNLKNRQKVNKKPTAFFLQAKKTVFFAFRKKKPSLLIFFCKQKKTVFFLLSGKKALPTAFGKKQKKQIKMNFLTTEISIWKKNNRNEQL